MKYPRVRFFDPLDLLLRIFQERWPESPDLELVLVSRDEGSPLPEGELGVTVLDHGQWLVYLAGDQTMWQLQDSLAHELAHVATGLDEHGPEWKSAYEYLRDTFRTEVERGEWSRSAGLRGPRLEATGSGSAVEITEANRRVLDVIEDHLGSYDVAPTQAEIAEQLGLSSKIGHHVRALVRAGAVFEPDGQSRGLVPTESGWADRGARLDPPLQGGLATRMLWAVRDPFARDPAGVVAELQRVVEYLRGKAAVE